MWQVQLAKDLVKTGLPFQDDLRRLKRRLVPYADTESNGMMAVRVGLHQIGLLRAAGANLRGDVLEIGSGWMPIVPLLFHAAGARKLILTDVRRLLDDATVVRATALVRKHAAMVASELGLSEAALSSRLDEPLNYEYRVPWEPSALPDASIDVVVSRTVLEHIPAALLQRYMGEFARIIRPGGAMCHNIDNSDHWEHIDKRIGRLNFLRYDDGWFWRAANVGLYQNRLRHSDYQRLFERAGWVSLIAEGEPDERALQSLRELPLSDVFARHDRRDLAILSSNFVLGRRPADG